MTAPAAPWRSQVDALVWLSRAGPAARRALPDGLGARPWLPVVLGGLVAYRSGPVGPYREVFAAGFALRSGALVAHVPFMAVDSAASVAGGRANWALPKVLAGFDGDPGRPGRVTARGDGWAIEARVRARSRRLPLLAAITCVQVWADGRARAFSVRMRGRCRLASVDLEHTAAPALAKWLPEGRHAAVLLSGAQEVTPPRG